MGNPGQRIRLQVDTGSSDTWMNWAKSSFCLEASKGCAEYGTFDFEASSSAEFVLDENKNPQSFMVSYTDNAQAKGGFVKDTLLIGGRHVKGVQFGLATATNVKIPVWGLGLPDNEVVVLLGTSQGYPNFVSTLLNDGLIKTTAYGLWLNDLNSKSGTVLFGGIDTAKFGGKLASFPVQVTGRYKVFAITLNHIGLSNSPSQGEFPSVSAQLDCGTTYSYLPSKIANAVWQALKAIPNSIGTPYVQCEYAKSPLTLDFTFGSKKIKVPMSQLIFHNPYETPLTSDSGVKLCTLGIIPADDQVTLGITFLRSAYVVYDTNRREVSIAQAKYTSASSIQELGPGGVPALYKAGMPGSDEVADEDGNQLPEGFIAQNPDEASASPSTPETETSNVPQENLEQLVSSGNDQLGLSDASGFNLENSGVTSDTGKLDAMADDMIDQS